MKKALIALLILAISTAAIAQVKFIKYNIFKDAFREPFEILYIFMYDGTAYKITTQHAKTVKISVDKIVSTLYKEGYTVKDIMTVCHNHWGDPRFSSMDIRTFLYLKKRGFKGSFLLFVQPQGYILILTDEKGESFDN